MLLSRQEAQLRARDILLAQRLASSGYIYIINSEGLLVVHPKKEMAGADMHEHWLARMQVERKQGFVEYEWQNPGEPEPRQKILAMEYFAPWDWIISVTAYRDELAQLIDVADIRDEVLAVKIGRDGYLAILDRKGEILAHPYLKGNIADLPKENSDLLQGFIATKEGRQTYSWIDARSGVTRQKIAVFSTLDDFGWASTSWTDSASRSRSTISAPAIPLCSTSNRSPATP